MVTGWEEEYAAYRDDAGSPTLRLASVLYLDVLGTKDNLSTTERAQQHLVRIQSAYARAREWAHLKADMPQVSRWFSDNLVLAQRFTRPLRLDMSTGWAVIDAGWIQLALLEDGLFARGGISVDHFYADAERVDGPALVTAYELESKQARFPRVMLADEAAAVCHEQLRLNGGDNERRLLITDGSGVTFVNYLIHLDFTEEGYDESIRWLEQHRDQIAANLKASAKGSGVREKYEWLAGYHDYFCNATLIEEVAKPLLIGVTHPEAVFEPFGEDIPRPEPDDAFE